MSNGVGGRRRSLKIRYLGDLASVLDGPSLSFGSIFKSTVSIAVGWQMELELQRGFSECVDVPLCAVDVVSVIVGLQDEKLDKSLFARTGER